MSNFGVKIDINSQDSFSGYLRQTQGLVGNSNTFFHNQFCQFSPKDRTVFLCAGTLDTANGFI